MPALVFFGEIFIALFALFFVVAIPVIILAVVFFVLRKNSRNRAAWQQLSRSTGLDMPNPKRLELRGTFNGVDIRLATGARRTGGSEGHTEFFTYCKSSFSNSLLLNLEIESDRGAIAQAMKTQKLKIGHENFDRSFTSVCYDPNVLRTLLLSDNPSLKTQNLMGDLMLANQSFGVILVTDKEVYVETGGQVGDEAVLRNMLETVSGLKKRFREARDRLPKANWEKELAISWGRFASEKGLSFDGNGFLISGKSDGFPVTIKLDTDSGKWQTVFELKFTTNLQIGLKIFPENSVHKALTWVGVQDIEIGIKEFDDRFIVKASNESMARHKLQPDLCRHLAVLFKDASAFIVDDSQVAFTFDSVVGDPKVLRGFALAAVAAAKMLQR